MINRYDWTLWLVPNVGNELIYTQYHCCRSFRYFWNKSARQQQSATTANSTLDTTLRMILPHSISPSNALRTSSTQIRPELTSTSLIEVSELRKYKDGNPEQQTNCPRRAFIFRFFNIGIWEPPVWLLKALSQILVDCWLCPSAFWFDSIRFFH